MIRSSTGEYQSLIGSQPMAGTHGVAVITKPQNGVKNGSSGADSVITTSNSSNSNSCKSSSNNNSNTRSPNNLSIIHEESEWRRRASSISSSCTEDCEENLPQSRGLKVPESPHKFVNVMCEKWKVRKDRDHLTEQGQQPSFLRRVFSALSPDLTFSLSHYRGGGMFGPPHSVGHVYSGDKGNVGTKPMQVIPTQRPSDSFESSVSVANANGVYQLDPSLQQISKRMQEILATIEGRCRMPAVRLLGFLLGQMFKLLFTQIDVDAKGVETARAALAKAANEGASVMLLPTHRSHIDYLLMSYVCFGFNLPTPHIAAGDNLNIPVVGALFSYSGAFFLRRSFRGDNLYKKVLYGYLLRKLREGAPVEVFVEGGRSRTGMVSDPKLGMLVMAVRFVRDGSVPDIMLLPASIDYERALETDEHVNQQLGSKKRGESLWGVLQSGWKLLTGSRFGKSYVNFEKGISIKRILDSLEKGAANAHQGFAPSSNASTISSATSTSSSSSINAHSKQGDLTPSFSSSSSSSSSVNCGYTYIPEEICVQAVADAVVQAQRRASFISPAALVAAALLGAEFDGDDQSAKASEIRIATLVMSLCKLVAHTGARTVDVLHLEKNPDELKRLLADSLRTLTPLLQVRADGPPRKRSGRSCKTSKGATEADQTWASDTATANQGIEADAKQRLRLRYCCGQLIPCLAPFGCVAAAVSALDKPLAFVPLDEVVATASGIAEMIKHALPGSRLDTASLRQATIDLVDAGALEELRRGVRPVASSRPQELLRCLRVIVAPAASAACATLTAMASLAPGSNSTSGGSNCVLVDEAELLKHSRNVVLSQCRRESTDWARQWQNSQLEAQQRQQRLLHGNSSDNDPLSRSSNHGCMAKMVGFPEALSTMALKKAIQGLTAMRVFMTGAELPASRTNSSGSISSLLQSASNQQPQQLLHQATGRMSSGGTQGFKRSSSQTHMSVISVASSVSLFGAGDCESEAKSHLEEASTSGSSEEVDHPNRSDNDSPTNAESTASQADNEDKDSKSASKHRRKNSEFEASASAAQAAAAAGHPSFGKNSIRLAPAYARPDGMLLLEKLASMQRCAFRGEYALPGHVTLSKRVEDMYTSITSEIRASGQGPSTSPALCSLKAVGVSLLASGALIRLLQTWQNRFKV